MEIELYQDKLPGKLEDLSKFILIKTAELTARRLALKAIKNLPESNEAYQTITKETQDLANDLLYASAKLGEMTSKIPLNQGGKEERIDNVVHTLPTKKARLKEIGLTEKQAERFETIAENKDIIEEVISESVKNNDIPTKSEVLKRAKKKDKEEKIEDQKQKILSGEMSLPEGIFDIIVVDPPWPYGRKYDPDTSRSANPYPEMSIDEIKAVKLTPDNDSILWLWTTHKFIWDAKDIMDLWGFEYKGIIVWNKEKMGMGDWLRMQCEFCLVGIKGKPLWDVKDLRDIITESRMAHSSKPDRFYKMIEEKFISKSEFKADYFGRKERKGWKIKK